MAEELDQIKLNGYSGVCKAKDLYSDIFSSPWAAEYSEEQRHKNILNVRIVLYIRHVLHVLVLNIVIEILFLHRTFISGSRRTTSGTIHW